MVDFSPHSPVSMAAPSTLNAPTISERHRRSNPDVPQDITDAFRMQHLNDPNLDLNQNPPRKASIASSTLSPTTTHGLCYNNHTIHHAVSLSDFLPSVNETATGPDAEGFETIEFGSTKGVRGVYIPSDIESQYTVETGYGDTASSRAILGAGKSLQTATAIIYDDEPPYPEVRAAVPNTDDPTLPVNTFRMWFLGILFATTVAGLNQLFSMRYPSVAITGIVVTILALPLGKALEWTLPTTRIVIVGYRLNCTLNPGPFNIKEHVCITIMTNVVAGGAYATDIIAAQRVFYLQDPPYSYQILLVLSTQILGFAIAGGLRQFVVYPASMIWPGNLVNAALFTTLHKSFGKKEKRHMSRERFFAIVAGWAFLWYWIPGFLFTGLSMFSWACWIAPTNVVVNALFGTNTGLGMSMLTFDWSAISFIGSPLVTPWWSTANTAVAFVLFFWIITPIVYFTNTWFTKFMPISDLFAYDNTGLPYDATAIIANGTFDAAKFEAYSPMFLPASLITAYGVAFASFSAVVVHTLLWYRTDIVRRFRNTLRDEDDCHARMMRSYSEVPTWWYQLMGAIALLLLLISIDIFPTELPFWGGIFAFLLAVVLSVPISMIQAMTNQQVSLNVMYEMIAGYIWPGKPVANMIFKTVAFIGTNQAVGFAGDLKLGHYMKIPPRVMFSVQVMAAVIGVFMSLLVQEFLFAFVPGFCTPDQPNGFSCPSTVGFGTASMIWGGVGPTRLFASGQM
jgi:OPT family small oligopeptide transporter